LYCVLSQLISAHFLTFSNYPVICDMVSQVLLFLYALKPKFYVHFLVLPYILHVPFISSFSGILTWPHTEYKFRLCVFLYVCANQNYVQEEIKSRSKSWNACYHLVQNLLSSSLLSKIIKIMIYRAIILLFVLYGCETWSQTFREDHT